ncbi:biopolymer transporter [Spirochaetia bacterium]|nr:biopolymer transporter [Spirochaetia bacterium]
MSLLELFQMGGIFMWPLLLFSIATVAIALERTIYFVYHTLRIDDLGGHILVYIQEGNIRRAQSYLRNVDKRRVAKRILNVLLDRADLPDTLLEKAVASESVTCINDLESGLSYLTVLGSLSPLTGFLGTVSGMIGAFRSIAEATEVNAQIVASGIYEALITTVFGLIIAIIAMIAHSIFNGLVDRFAANVEKTCSMLLTEVAVTNTKKSEEASGSKHEPVRLITSGKPVMLHLEDYT